jgi:signal peptidase II
MNRKNLSFFWFSLIVILISLDQASKYIIRASGGFYICNPHIAFGLSFPVIYIVLGLFFILFLYNIIFQPKADPPWAENFKFQISNFNSFFTLSTILIFSGALSNIIDRFFFGCVIDFIDLRIWPVFNLADIYITIGATIIIVKHITHNMKQKN